MVWFAVAMAVIAVISAIATFIMMNSMGADQGDSMQPRKDLDVTMVQEGHPVTIVYGTCRIAPTLLFYSRIISEAVTSTHDAGKDDVTVVDGYNYFCDAWISLCFGKVELVKMYWNDLEKVVQCSQEVFNDGTENEFASFLLNAEYGGALTDVATTINPVGNWSSTFNTPVKPGSFGMVVTVWGWQGIGVDACVLDDGAGHIVGYHFRGNVMGSINYATGEVSITFDPLFANCSAKYNYSYGSTTMDFAIPMPGIAHLAWQRVFVGFNVWNFPNIHYVVKRKLTTPLTYTEETNGQNPAACIWDMLTNTFYGMGEPAGRLNQTSFNAASVWYHNQGYGINFKITKAGKLQDHVNKVLNWVGGSLYKDVDGKWALQVFDPSLNSSVSLSEDDFSKFKLHRQSWYSTENEIRATWTNPEADYKEQMVPIRDPANIAIQQRTVAASVDLTCFTDKTALSKRLWEVLRYRTYPRLQIEFTISEKYSAQVYAGIIVSISHESYGLTDVKFRITKVPSIKPDSLEISYEAEQVIEAITDGSYSPVIPEESSRWTPPTVDPAALVHTKVFELPWNEGTGSSMAFLLLMARASIEDRVQIIQSFSGADYVSVLRSGTFAQQGTLKTTYGTTTYEIDDTVGILYTPHRNDPEPDDLTRQNLFFRERFVIIDNEIMRFQYQTPEGTTDYRLTGVVRGAFGTTIASHTAGAEIWIVEPADNVAIISTAAQFYLKFLTQINARQISAGSVSPVTVTPAGTAKVPWPVTKIEATRDGSNNVVVIWWPRTRDFIGAGQNAEATVDTSPFNFDADFQYRINYGTPVSIANTTYTWNVSGQVTFEVRQRIETAYSDWVSVTVGAGAGRYVNGISGALGY